MTIAFSSILVRLSHASPSTAAIFRCAYALPALGLLAALEDRRLGRRSWAARRPSLVAGVFFAADLLMWHNSIADVGAGLSTVLANIQVVLVPFVAWVLLSEPPPRRVLAALPLAGAGVVLISGALEHSPYGRAPTAGTLYGLGAGVAYVGFLLLLRRGGADPGRRPGAGAARSGGGAVHPAAGPLFDATAVATVICVIAGLVIGDARLVPSWPGAGWLVLLAFSSQVLGWLLISSTLPRLPAAMTSLILCVQPLGTVALAALILGESPSGLQLLGVGLVLAALLAAGRAVRRPGVQDALAPASPVPPGASPTPQPAAAPGPSLGVRGAAAATPAPGPATHGAAAATPAPGPATHGAAAATPAPGPATHRAAAATPAPGRDPAAGPVPTGPAQSPSERRA